MTDIWNSKLLDALNDLEEKYGVLPSITATQADYIEDLDHKQKLFEQAYAQALTLSDGAQLLLLSQSMSELMIEEIGNRQLGQKWLTEYEKYLVTDGDESAFEQFKKLKMLLNKL